MLLSYGLLIILVLKGRFINCHETSLVIIILTGGLTNNISSETLFVIIILSEGLINDVSYYYILYCVNYYSKSAKSK